MLVDPSLLPGFLSGIHLFGKLNDEQLGLIAAGMDARLFHAGEIIYQVGDDAIEFYIIYKGKVRIQREMPEEQDYLGVLVPGDFLGREALGAGDYRITSATAVEDTILLTMNGDFLVGLGADIPPLRERLRMMIDSFNLMWNAPIRWREPDEMIYYITRRHSFFLFARMLGPLMVAFVGLVIFVIGESLAAQMVTPWLIAGLFLVVAVLWGIWSYIDWSNDYYIITDRRIIYLERIILLYDSRTESPLDAILAVNQNTTQVGRIIGYGNVTVKSYTGTIVLGQIEHTQEVQMMIEKLLLRARAQQEEEKLRAIDQALYHRLGGRAARQAQSAAASAPQEPTLVEYSGMQSWLMNFLHMRTEEGGNITYRKHWFVLLRATFLPGVLLLGELILLFSRLFNLYTFVSVSSVVLLLLLAMLLTFLWLAYQYLDWNNDIYIVTSDQIVDVDKKPLGTESRKTAPIKNILSIEYERLGFIGYLFNFGTVFIKVGETTFTFDYVFNPSEVQRDLFNRFSEYKFREKQAEDLAEERRLTDWIEGYHRWQEQQPPPTAEPPPGTYPPTNPFS